MATATFSADVDSDLLEEANAALSSDGITLHEAFYMLLNIAIEKRLPSFGCFKPNAETLAAIAEAEVGGLITVGSVADLMAHLNEDD